MPLRQLRVRQIRLATTLLIRIGRARSGARVLAGLRSAPGAAAFLRLLTGYRSVFPTFDAAQSAITKVSNGGHENPAIAEFHLAINTSPRPSDYPVLYHLRPIAPQISRVFDLGGSLGNVFYAFQGYLDFAPGLHWTVYELPSVVRTGAALARERGAKRLTFTEALEDAEGVDLFIASGSAHYFPTPLPAMIAALRRGPRWVLLNRSPLHDGPTVATVQDGMSRLACMLYNKAELVRSFDAAGYDLVDEWQVAERSHHVPGYPEYTIPHYTGLFLVRREQRVAGVGRPTASAPDIVFPAVQ